MMLSVEDVDMQQPLGETVQKDIKRHIQVTNELSQLIDSDQQHYFCQPYLVNSEKLKNVLISRGFALQGSKGQLMNKFLNSVISKAAQNMDDHDSCAHHSGEKITAFDNETRSFGCEKCVYEGIYKNPMFVSSHARQIKDDFDKEYFDFVNFTNSVQDVSPQYIIQNIKGQISQFFMMIRKKLEEIEADIFRKVKDSDGLRGLAQIIQEMNEECDDQLRELIEEEKKSLDEKVDTSKYSFIVIKSQFYQLGNDISKSKMAFQDLIQFMPDEEAVSSLLYQIFNKCLRVDNQPVNLDVKQKFDSSILKKSTIEQRNAFVCKENIVYSIDLLNKQIAEIQKLKDLFIPKLMSIDDNNVLMIGGQSQMDYSRHTVIKKTCYMLAYYFVDLNLLNNSNGGQWKTTSQAVMKKQRVSFASCFLGSLKSYVFVSGGFGAGRRTLGETEIFNVIDNFWTMFPNMNQPRASHSMMQSENMKWVYVFGGTDENNMLLNSIERVRMNDVVDPTKNINSSWAIINLILQIPLVNVGCISISNSKEILLFGGMNEMGDQVNTATLIDSLSDDRDQHQVSNKQVAQLTEGDAFPNAGCIYHSSNETYMVGNSNIWNINERDRKVSKFLAINQ